MLFRPALVTLLCSGLLTLAPVSSWSGPSQEGYDCVKTGRSGYRCVKGPLTGRTFPSQKAMILALTKSPNGQNGTVADRAPQAKTDKDSAKKAKVEKASHKKGQTDNASPKKSKKAKKG